MKKLVDVRCYVTPEVKKQIKYYALLSNISVSRWLQNLIEDDLATTQHELNIEAVLNNELQEILLKLSNSANLPTAEREKLKKRKNEIKTLMKGVKKNGKEEQS